MIKLHGFILRIKKILSTLSKGKDKYYIPGGKREAFENDVETLVREIKEELSVDKLTNSIRYYDTFKAQAHGKKEGIIVKMSCYTADFDGEIKADSEISKVVWLNYDDINKISPVDQLIFEDLHDKGLID